MNNLQTSKPNFTTQQNC